MGIVGKKCQDQCCIRCQRSKKFEFGTIDVYDMKLVDMDKLGEVVCFCLWPGNAAFQYVKKVIELAMNHEVDATVTNALNKKQ